MGFSGASTRNMAIAVIFALLNVACRASFDKSRSDRKGGLPKERILDGTPLTKNQRRKGVAQGHDFSHGATTYRKRKQPNRPRHFYHAGRKIRYSNKVRCERTFRLDLSTNPFGPGVIVKSITSTNGTLSNAHIKSITNDHKFFNVANETVAEVERIIQLLIGEGNGGWDHQGGIKLRLPITFEFTA